MASWRARTFHRYASSRIQHQRDLALRAWTSQGNGDDPVPDLSPCCLRAAWLCVGLDRKSSCRCGRDPCSRRSNRSGSCLIDRRSQTEATMRNSLRTLLCCSTLCAGLAATSANAAETRTTGFSIPCNGVTQQVLFNATGFAAATTRFVQGTEVAITSNPDRL